MEFGILFRLLSFSGIFLFKVSLPDKMPIFSGSGSSSFISCEKDESFI